MAAAAGLGPGRAVGGAGAPTRRCCPSREAGRQVPSGRDRGRERHEYLSGDRPSTARWVTPPARSRYILSHAPTACARSPMIRWCSRHYILRLMEIVADAPFRCSGCMTRRSSARLARRSVDDRHAKVDRRGLPPDDGSIYFRLSPHGAMLVEPTGHREQGDAFLTSSSARSAAWPLRRRLKYDPTIRTAFQNTSRRRRCLDDARRARRCWRKAPGQGRSGGVGSLLSSPEQRCHPSAQWRSIGREGGGFALPDGVA